MILCYFRKYVRIASVFTFNFLFRNVLKGELKSRLDKSSMDVRDAQEAKREAAQLRADAVRLAGTIAQLTRQLKLAQSNAARVTTAEKDRDQVMMIH